MPDDSENASAEDLFDTNCFLYTSANARVTNAASYVQQGLDLLEGHLHLEAGLRFDYFRFNVTDNLRSQFSGVDTSGRLQPKASVAYLPSHRFPTALYFNYGRGIASQDARGVVRQPDAPKVSTTDFYQLGAAHNTRRASLSANLFLIDQSNQQVYIPDDGSIEFAGASRSYGYEIKNSIQIFKALSFNAGLTQVTNSFYRGTLPRVYVDSAPHTVANAGLTLSGYRGFTGSLRYRHIGSYRLDGEDAGLARASGHDVIDLSFARRLRRNLDFNFAIDNLTNKRYFETQNRFESRIAPDADIVSRIHGTPGYPFTVTAGITFRVRAKG